MKQMKFTALLCCAALLLSACSARQPSSAASKSPEAASGSEITQTVADDGGDLSLLPLKTGSIQVGDMLLPAAAATTASIDLSFPQTFAITRPAEPLTTTFANYFITGTSNPSQPVYFGDTVIERQGTKGLFGVRVSLEMGANTFTFRQGNESKTVTITRTAETRSRISAIVQDSMYPAYFGSATAGDTLLVECTAPSGASVSATFNGSSANLQQVGSDTDGLPVTFRGSIPVTGSYTAGQLTNGGKITYNLTYGGSSSSYTSSGEVYIAGDGAKIPVRVNQYLGTLYDDPAVKSVFRALLKEGAVDYITSQDNDYYKLASGGYLPTSMADIVADKQSITNQFSSVSSNFYTKSETYTFQGTEKPVFSTKTGDSTFSITFYNTSGTPVPTYSSSRLFSNIAATDNGTSVTYTFTQKAAGNLWGYNINYDGNNTVLRIAYKPALAGGSTPLSGIAIVIDPGHGDHDTGAKGVPGDTGPKEDKINLAHAQVVKRLLEEKGATVYMTRTTADSFLELNERLEFFENSGADMFLSLHHNSMAESGNANDVTGLEMYYHTPSSKNLANYMINALATGTGRRKRSVNKDYFRVTILPYAPSLLCELGYLTNPLEYEKVTTQSEIDKTAAAIVDGVVAALS